MSEDKIRKIHPIRIKPSPFRPLGEVLQSELYSNTLLIARKKSGKSTTINHLLKNTIDDRTTVYIFCSTAHIDKTWLAIQKMLKRRGIVFNVFTSVIENGVNVLETILETLAIKTPEEPTKSIIPPPPPHPICLFDDMPNPDEPKKKKKIPWTYKYDVPEHYFILDDLAQYELRGNTISDLFKKNSHYHCKTAVSSQHSIHLTPATYSQTDYVYIWKGFSRHYMDKIYENLKLSCEPDEFFRLYEFLTQKTYSFMNVDIKEGIARTNFSKDVYKI
jgi:hypothetical protein